MVKLFRKFPKEEIEKNRKSLPKDHGYITLGCAFLGICFANIFDKDPVAHLFALGEILIIVIFVTIFFYKVASRTYGVKEARKKQLMFVLASLSCLFFIPITIIWQFFNVKSLANNYRHEYVDIKDDIKIKHDRLVIQYLWLGYVSMCLSLLLLAYANYTSALK